MLTPPKNQTSNLQVNQSMDQFVEQINSAFGVNLFTSPNVVSSPNSSSKPQTTSPSKPETSVTQQNNKTTNQNLTEDRKNLKEQLEKNRKEWMQREGIRDESTLQMRPQKREEPSLSELIRNARSTINSISIGSIYSMKGSDAIEYAKRSIGDMEQKMAQIASLSALANVMDSGGTQNKQNTNISNSASNNVQNITQVSSDYLGSLRMGYETYPSWRTSLG